MSKLERCGLCGKVTASVSLLRYEGICFYCWVDTSSSEDAEFVRSKFNEVGSSSPSPSTAKLHRVSELLVRRTKREALWSGN